MLNKKTTNLTFFSQIDLSICPNTYEFLQIFFNLRNFFFSFEKLSEVTKFGYVFAKRICTGKKIHMY